MVVYPQSRLTLSKTTLVGRTYLGRRLWTAPAGIEIDDLLTGGRYLLLRFWAPPFGAAIRYATYWPEILGSQTYALFSLQTHRVLWRANCRDTGRPIWMNGRVLLTIWIDTSPRAIRAAPRRPLPVWIQERSLRNQAILWRRRLPGLPRLCVKVEQEGRDTAVCGFSGERWQGVEFPFVRQPGGISVAFPLPPGGIPRREPAVVHWAADMQQDECHPHLRCSQAPQPYSRQPATVTFDPNGNQQIENAGEQVTGYSWDRANGPTGAAHPSGPPDTFLYSADNLSQTVTAAGTVPFVWGQENVLRETDQNGMAQAHYTESHLNTR